MRKIKFISFVAAFCALFICVSWFFRPTTSGQGVIYYEPRDTVDALFIGSSHIHYGINPNIMWREEGIAAYNFSSPGQPLWTSYNYIKESLKSQSPAIIVLDVVYAFRNYDNGYRPNEQNMYSAFLPSMNKVDMIQTGAEPEQRTALLIDLLFYHTRWSSLTQSSVPYDKYYYSWKNDMRYKGYYLNNFLNVANEAAEYNETVYPTTAELGELPEKNRYYLQRIIDFSKEKGVELLLIKTPTAMPFKNEEEQKAYNTVKQIAEENQIRFIDYNEKLHRDAMAFDFTTDMCDEGHLNCFGAGKLSTYMAKLLKNEYNLPDRRGDERYKSWDKSADGYFRVEAMEKAKLNTDLISYVNALKDVSQDLIVITSVRDDASGKIKPINSQLSPLGITADFTDKYRHSYISIYEVSSGYHYEEISPKSLEKNIYKDDLPINAEVFSGGQPVGNRSSIKIDGKERSKNQRGLNIVIYDKVLETVFDSFSVDTCGDETFAIKR